MPYPRWPFISIVVCAVLLAVVLAVFRTKLRTLDVFSAFLLFGAAVLSVLIVLYTRSLRRAQQIQLDTEERLQEMADNIQEIVWMIDAETKKALYVNRGLRDDYRAFVPESAGKSVFVRRSHPSRRSSSCAYKAWRGNADRTLR